MLLGLSNHAFLENWWFVGITWLEWGTRLQALPPSFRRRCALE